MSMENKRNGIDRYSTYKEEARNLLDQCAELNERINFLESQVEEYRKFFKEVAKPLRKEVSKEAQSYGKAMSELELVEQERALLLKNVAALAIQDSVASKLLERYKSKYIN